MHSASIRPQCSAKYLCPLLHVGMQRFGLLLPLLAWHGDELHPREELLTVRDKHIQLRDENLLIAVKGLHEEVELNAWAGEVPERIRGVLCSTQLVQ